MIFCVGQQLRLTGLMLCLTCRSAAPGIPAGIQAASAQMAPPSAGRNEVTLLFPATLSI